jgi:hypothetical protein
VIVLLIDSAENLLADLQGAVAVDLGDGDLRQVVAVEERQQVVAQLPRVVGERGLLELATARLEPLRRELVERRGGRRLRGVGDAWCPQSALDVGQDVAQLDLRLWRVQPSPAPPSVTKCRRP